MSLLTRPPNWHHPRHSKPPWITAITHTHSRLFLSESGSPIRKFFSSSFFEYTALGSSSGSTLGVSANLTTQSPQSVFLFITKMAVGLSATPSANAFIPLTTLVSVLQKSCPPRLPLVTQNEGVAWFDSIKLGFGPSQNLNTRCF